MISIALCSTAYLPSDAIFYRSVRQINYHFYLWRPTSRPWSWYDRLSTSCLFVDMFNQWRLVKIALVSSGERRQTNGIRCVGSAVSDAFFSDSSSPRFYPFATYNWSFEWCRYIQERVRVGLCSIVASIRRHPSTSTSLSLYLSLSQFIKHLRVQSLKQKSLLPWYRQLYDTDVAWHGPMMWQWRGC